MSSSAAPPAATGAAGVPANGIAPGAAASSAVVASGSNKLSLRHVFGCRGGQKNNIFHIEDQQIVYTAGRNVVVFSSQHNTQRFISGTEKTAGITALTVSSNRKLLAVAERSKRAVISIYELPSLKKKKVLQFNDEVVEEWTSLSFSSDGKTLVTLGGAPFYQLVFWSWEKSKVMAACPLITQTGGLGTTAGAQAGGLNPALLAGTGAGAGSSGNAAIGSGASSFGGGHSVAGGSSSASPTTFTVTQVTCDPNDSSVCLVTGQSVLKFLRFISESQTIKAVGPNAWGKRELQNYMCHTWIPGENRVLVGTEAGEILVLENLELKCFLHQSPLNGPIEVFTPLSKGFVCGGAKGMLYFYEKIEGDTASSQIRDLYRRTKQVSVYDKQSNEYLSQIFAETGDVRVTSLSLDMGEENLSVGLDNNQLLSVNVTSTELLKSEGGSLDLLAQSFHSLTVTGVDSCYRKPLIATCGTDKSVRIWNYAENTLEVCKYFQDEAYSVALHPSGLHILVGFHDKLRLCNILMNDIRPYKEFSIRSCSEVRFSNGGQYFAAVNGNMIQLFSTYSCENIGNLRGHNGKVRSIAWAPNDNRLVSCGIDGAVYEWSLEHFRREGEHVLKICNYSSVAISQDGEYIYAAGSDRKLKEISNSTVTSEFDVGQHAVTQVVISYQNKALFAGCEDGSVRCYSMPLSETFTEVPVHAGPVTKMILSADETMLFTVSEDGCVGFVSIKPPDGPSGQQKKDISFAEEILITKSDLEDKVSLITELKTKVDELKLENEYQLRKTELEYNEKMKEITEHFKIELQIQSGKYDKLASEKSKQEVEFQDTTRKKDEQHKDEISRLQLEFTRKLQLQEDHIQQLKAEMQMRIDQMKEQEEIMRQTHERMVEELQDEYEERLREQRELAEALRQEKNELIREHEELRRQIDEDADKEIEDLRHEYEAKLAEEREQTLRLKGEYGIMRNDFHERQRTIEDLTEKIRSKEKEVQDLKNNISSLNKDITSHKKEIKERDETITDKEKRIYDLKKKNQELEKFKFVLDYKIKELKKQIEPKELEITEMQEQIREMDDELEKYHQKSSNMELQLSDMVLKLEGQQNEINKLKQKIREYERAKNTWKSDLHDTLQTIQDPKRLKQMVKNLYQKYVNQSIKKTEFEHDIQAEYNRQREYLEKTNESLKEKLDKLTEAHQKDSGRIMQENVALIREINQLRRELKLAKLQAKPDLSSARGRRSPGRSGIISPSSSISTVSATVLASFPEEARREIEMQKMEIRRLRERCSELEARMQEQRALLSRERLPTMSDLHKESFSMPRASSAPSGE